MIKKPFLLIIINIFSFICYIITYRVTRIKNNYEKWKDFYEKNNYSPFNYITNFLPFQTEELFLKISNFNQQLSFFIFNTGYNIEDFEEEDSQVQLFNNTHNLNKNNSLLSSSNVNYEDYYSHAIDEINLLDDAVDNKYILNIKPILEEGLNKNKIIILFMFFIEQLNIFKYLKHNFDLNKIYLLGKNRTDIQKLELTYEMIFNYEDILEMIMLSNQFIDYHKDYGFFIFDQLKNEKIPKISKTETQLVNMINNLKDKNYDEYKNLNDVELAYFLNIFEKTTRSINYLGMTESLYKKGKLYYNRDVNSLKLGFIAFTIFINLFILIHYDDKEIIIKKRKKYKFN